MSNLPDPRGFLRDGVELADTVGIPLPSGVEVRVRPARCTPADYLAGRASAYALAAVRGRDMWVQADRSGSPVDTVALGGLIVEAIRDVYDVTGDEVAAWLEGIDQVAAAAILGVAVGGRPVLARERGRARALVAGGFGAVPLSAVEAAAVADWSVNAGRAPSWG